MCEHNGDEVISPCRNPGISNRVYKVRAKNFVIHRYPILNKIKRLNSIKSHINLRDDHWYLESSSFINSDKMKTRCEKNTTNKSFCLTERKKESNRILQAGEITTRI